MHSSALLLVGLLGLVACTAPAQREPALVGVPYEAKGEVVVDFGALVPAAEGAREQATPVRLERVSAGVPWPRGVVSVDGEIIVLARGRHRNAGGVDHSIEDFTGCLFRIDPDIAEPVIPGALASPRVAANAALLVRADPSVFQLPDVTKAPIDDVLMSRPYCTLIFDPVSRNLIVCGYSGVDLPAKRFRKNATDAIFRYDLRTERWHTVEQHDASVVPPEELGYAVSNVHYPHHDPALNAAPHGWLNGPNGGCVVGEFLYAAAKDNHVVVQYDLTAIREDPDAGCPPSRVVLDSMVELSSPRGSALTELLGPSAIAVQDDFLYVGYRTSSVVVRFPLAPNGDLVQPLAAQLVAVFEPWDSEKQRSANLIDLAFDSRGELFVSCSRPGTIWKVGKPDPERPFYGDSRGERPLKAPPYADLTLLTGKPTSCGNLHFDARDRLYLCAGSYDTESDRIAGVIYRVVADEPVPGS
ncbi:MAG: hypothetical protein WD226_09010 [Planctomycetota bacterium]